MPALDRHAHGLADAVVDDRLSRAEPRVGRGVGGDDALTLAEHVIDDRPRDLQPLVGLGGPSPADGLGDELAGLVAEQDHAAVGADRVENELQNLREQRIDLDDAADRLRRTVHDGQAGEPLLEPLAGRAGGLEDARALVGGDALEDRRTVAGAGQAEQVDAVGQLARGRRGGVEEHDRLAEPHLVARLQAGLLDGLAVDVSTVGRADVDDAVAVAVASDLRMSARDLVVVEPDRVRRVAAEPGRAVGELEPLPLVGPLDDEQRGHARPPSPSSRGPG